MQARRHVAAVADAPMHEGKMQDRIERGAIGVALKLADRRLDRKAGDPLDQLLARLPVGDHVGDRNALDLVLVGEGLDLRPDHHGAVVVGEFADDGDRRQAGKLAEVDRGLGVAGAHEHAAILGDKRKNMAGTDEIARAHVAIGERAHGVRALLGRNAGRQSMTNIGRHGEGGAERRVIGRHHRSEIQPPRIVAGQRNADDAAAIADDEGHLLGGAKRSGDDQVALVLAIVVVGDGDDLATGESLDGVCDGIEHIGSLRAGGPLRKSFGVTAPCVSATIRSAVSRESQDPCSRQISVTAPGETPMRRAKSVRDTWLRLSQSPSFIGPK